MPKQITAFIGHSFSRDDQPTVSLIKGIVSSLGLKIVSGESPEAISISDKIKKRINISDVFIGIFTRRHFIQDNENWTTLPWVIEEKGYSLGQNNKRPIIILVEEGINIRDELGGLGGDLEYIVFERAKLENVRNKLKSVLRGLILV